MKAKKKSRKRAAAKDLAPARRRARDVRGGAISITRLSPPSPPAGPVPIPYPN